jgi:hypothetical protein
VISAAAEGRDPFPVRSLLPARRSSRRPGVISAGAQRRGGIPFRGFRSGATRRAAGRAENAGPVATAGSRAGAGRETGPTAGRAKGRLRPPRRARPSRWPGPRARGAVTAPVVRSG